MEKTIELNIFGKKRECRECKRKNIEKDSYFHLRKNDDYAICKYCMSSRLKK